MVFSQIALLFGIACLFAVISFKLKQPLIVGYVFAGLVLGGFGILTKDSKILDLGEIGVSLLLFLVGLEMDISDIKKIGRTSFVFGFFQIILTSVLGFLLSKIFGFGTVPSLYIAFSLTFSSTIIAVTLLSEKRELNSLYGKISLGYLLVQDLFAILILIFLGGGSHSDPNFYISLLVKAVGLLLLVWFLAKKAMPIIFSYISTSAELGFVFSISWALVFSAVVAGPFGFNLEIGGFLAGITLSTLSEHMHIASKTRPLRDFFLVIFFLLLGMRANLNSGISNILVPFLGFSLFVILVKPLVELTILRFLGFKKKTSFLVSIGSSQISEFSFILMSLGLTLKHIDSEVVTLIVLVGLVTMVFSTYLDRYANLIYRRLSKYLSIFEKSKTSEVYSQEVHDFSNHIILVGCDRTGKNLLSYFMKHKKEFVVIDFNPEVISDLATSNIPFVFGDASDPEILSSAQISKAKAIVSTISRLNDNLVILSEFSKTENKPISIFTASTKSDALKLYEMGASYVVVPENAASEHIRHILQAYLGSKSKLQIKGKHHFERLMLTI